MITVGWSYRDSFEDIKTIVSSADNRSWNLRMPVDLFDIFLTLVNKE